MLREDAGGVTAYLGAVEVQITGTQRLTQTYYFVGGQRIAMRAGSVVTYLHGDHLGSVILTIDDCPWASKLNYYGLRSVICGQFLFINFHSLGGIMGKIAIVTDSTAGLSTEFIEEFDIPIIPLNVHWGDDTYKDGVTLDAEMFYRRLPERQDLPKTSQPSAGEFMAFYEDAAKHFKTDTVLGIYISSKLSGTCASASLAKSSMPDLNIEVFDSLSISSGAALMVREACRMARDGAEMATILARLEQMRANTYIYFAVDTLEFLHRGGRIGGAARLLGTTLNLKPLLAILEGRVESLEKVRRRRKSLQRVVSVATEKLLGKFPKELFILHTGEDQDVDFVVDLINEQLKPQQIFKRILTPVVGTHTGPGVIGVAFHTLD